MTATEDLRRAAGLVEQSWTQRVFARDAEGRQVDATGADATSFSVLGALYHVTQREPARLQSCVDALEQRLGLQGAAIPKWQDESGRLQADVVDALWEAAYLVVE